MFQQASSPWLTSFVFLSVWRGEPIPLNQVGAGTGSGSGQKTTEITVPLYLLAQINKVCKIPPFELNSILFVKFHHSVSFLHHRNHGVLLNNTEEVVWVNT